MANYFEINSVTQSGRLTRDPELRQTPNGTSVCTFAIAQNARQKNSNGDWIDRPLYFEIVAWAGLAEQIAQQYRKGDPIAVDGKLDYRAWEAQDGSKRSKVEIVAESLFKGQRNVQSGAREQVPPDDDFRDIDFGGDDIPF